MIYRQANLLQRFFVHVHIVHDIDLLGHEYTLIHSTFRIIMTSSAAGLYGNFGQANYSAGMYLIVTTLKLVLIVIGENYVTCFGYFVRIKKNRIMTA